LQDVQQRQGRDDEQHREAERDSEGDQGGVRRGRLNQWGGGAEHVRVLASAHLVTSEATARVASSRTTAGAARRSRTSAAAPASPDTSTTGSAGPSSRSNSRGASACVTRSPSRLSALVTQAASQARRRHHVSRPAFPLRRPSAAKLEELVGHARRRPARLRAAQA